MKAKPKRRFAGLRRLVRGAIRVDQAATAYFDVGVVSTVVMVLYVLVFIPVGLVVLAGCMLVALAVAILLPGAVAGYVVLGGLGLGLLIVGVVFVKLYRRLPTIMKDFALDADALLPENDELDAGTVGASTALLSPASSHSPAVSLADLDARLAPLADHRPA